MAMMAADLQYGRCTIPRSEKPLARLCADILDQEIASVRTLLQLADLALDKPPAPGSGIDKLNAWMDSLPRDSRSRREHVDAVVAVVNSSGGTLRRLLENALDHSQTLGGALRSGRSLGGSALTLSRGILEAILQVCYILDPRAHPRTTVLRALAYDAATFEGNEAAAVVFGERVAPDKQRLARESVDGYHRWLAKSGFSRGYAKDTRQSTWVGLGDEHVNLRFNVTDAMREYLFGEGFYYAVQSGAAHSRGWMLATSYLPDETGKMTTPDQHALIATAPLLDASETLAKSIGFWMGLDTKSIVDKTHFRRRALLAGRGHEFSPISLDDYRSRTGARTHLGTREPRSQ